VNQHHKFGGGYKHNTLLEKQLEFFKERDQTINCTQMGMVKAPTNLIIMMTMAFNQVAKNNNNNMGNTKLGNEYPKPIK
jgi:hypothetical protein